MNPRLIMLVVVLAIAGCRSQQASLADPFMGRTRVPPPGTGTAQTAPGADPYYANPSGAGVARPLAPMPQTASPAPLQATPPAGYVPSPSSGYRSGPAGPYNFQGSAVEQTQSLGSEGSRVRVPPPAMSNIVSRSPADAASSAAADAGLSDTRVDRSVRAASYEGSGDLSAGRQRIVRTIPPRNPVSLEAARPAVAASSGTTTERRASLLPLPDRATDIMDLPATRAKTAATASGASDTSSLDEAAQVKRLRD